MKIKTIAFGLLLLSLITSMGITNNASYAYGPISLSVTVSKGIAMADGQDKAQINVYVSGANYVKVTTDEGDTQYGNFGNSYQTYYLTFSLNKLRLAQVKVEAFGNFGAYSVKYVYIRIQLNPAATTQKIWFDRAHDYARSHSSQNTLQDKIELWDVGWEFVKFAHRIDSSIDLSGLTPDKAVYALHLWAKDYFAYFWTSSSTSYTAIETANAFSSFDGSTDDRNTYTITKRDCSSMAAFLSGVATAFGLPSRMISDSYAIYPIFHMFVEIYGLTTLTSKGDPYNNNGWFLIDPANGNPDYKSSYTPINQYIDEYARYNWNAIPEPRYETKRLYFIWGMTSSGWGNTVPDLSRQTFWEGYQNPPYQERYTNNPWDIYILS